MAGVKAAARPSEGTTWSPGHHAESAGQPVEMNMSGSRPRGNPGDADDKDASRNRRLREHRGSEAADLRATRITRT